jgi:hypothetical protein
MTNNCTLPDSLTENAIESAAEVALSKKLARMVFGRFKNKFTQRRLLNLIEEIAQIEVKSTKIYPFPDPIWYVVEAEENFTVHAGDSMSEAVNFLGGIICSSPTAILEKLAEDSLDLDIGAVTAKKMRYARRIEARHINMCLSEALASVNVL